MSSTAAFGEQADLFSFFGFATEDVKSKEEAKAEAKAAKVEAVSSETKAGGTSSAESADKPKKKKVGITGETKVEFPVTVYGRGFKVTIENPTTPANVNGVIRSLYNAYPEIGIGGDVYYNKEVSTIIVNASPSAAEEDVLVDVPVTVVYGQRLAEFNKESFIGVDADEISVDKLIDKWVAVNGEYTGCGMAYNPKSKTASPVATGDAKTKITLPAEISVSGEVQSISAENFGGKSEVDAKEVTDYIFGADAKMSVKYYELGGIIVCEYFFDYKSKVNNIDWSFAETNAKAQTKKAVSKYNLPLKVYFATIGQNIELDSATFNGKDKVTEEDVMDFLKKSYSFLNSKDRQIDVIYCKETNTLSVALVSGKKG